MKWFRPLLAVLCLTAMVFAGCTGDPAPEEPQDEQEDRPDAPPAISLQDLEECIWEYPDGAVPCQNRAMVVEPLTVDMAAECVAEFPGSDEDRGARLLWDADQGTHSIEYWAPPRPGTVTGILAVTEGNETTYYNWDQHPDNATDGVDLGVDLSGRPLSLLVFRTHLQTGSPHPADLAWRVDWDLLVGFDSPWPVRVMIGNGTEYHLKPATTAPEDEVFAHQWNDLMEIEGTDFHWLIRYDRMVRDDLTAPETPEPGC